MTTRVSQIFISDTREKLSPFLEFTSQSISKSFKDCKHKIYNNEELREFIKLNYPNEVVWAYDKLRPYSYKSDLGRFCLLYKLGGWYFDIGIRSVKGINIENDIDMICFRDEQRHSKTSWAASGGIIWSKPENSILAAAIEGIILNCKQNWYGRTPLCPTGPALYGEAIVKHNREKNIIFGDLVRPMIPFTRRNFPYFKHIFKAKFVLPYYKTIGIVKPSSGGDLKSLGVKGGNNYNHYWHTRSVYNDIQFTYDYK
tara:strand:- start:368 stop:1135 length:768 start_codon:yes stop_codon:yes gene_type:complete